MFFNPFFHDFPDDKSPLIYNLFSHKVTSGILSSDFDYAKNNIHDIKSLLIKNSIIDTRAKSCTDQIAKLNLCARGLLTPNTKEQEVLNFLNSNSDDLKNLPYDYDHSKMM